MADNSSLVRNNASRIHYIEPNDTLGHISGKPVTPDYTDFCVAFRLTGEIMNRTRYNGFEGENGKGQTIVVSWNGSKEDLGSKNVEFSGGNDVGGKSNYLTTFYTDISYQDIKEHDTVEGLGVESIDIQFKNYYTPTITIKFIDVRGSSLFGREEAIHKNGEITAENIFGCFFTMPYPKFKLQIKGYYGREVTYQLYCSNFKGNFNSETGNFEATVTFLGYMYGILADIPMAYIMIAPYCSYSGSDYWDKHVSDEEWKLYETSIGFSGEPVKMFKLKEDIKSAIRGDRQYFQTLLSGLDAKEIGVVSNQIYVSENIVRSYLKILKSINGVYKNGLVVEGNWLKYEPNEIMPTEDSLKEIVGNEIIEYNENLKAYNKSLGTNYKDFIFKEGTSDGCTFYYNRTHENIGNKDKYTLFIKIPSEIIDSQQTGDISDKTLEKFKTKAEKNSNTITIKHFIGLYPYIGNVIKNSLCHLETFMKMMKDCIDEVYANKDNRTFSKLKIPIENTDCKDDDDVKYIPPFPGITIVENIEEVKNDDTSFETPNEAMLKNIGWLGDFTSDAPEVALVNSIFEAMQKKDVNDKNNKNNKKEDYNTDEEIAKNNRDVKVAIYMHLKNIYDRWLINDEFNEYKVKTYFKNFVFIDSFFRDISFALHVNPETLGNSLESVSNDDGRFLKFISTLASKEHCSIFGFPDTFMFSDGNDKIISMDKGLEDAFKPFPYSQIGPIKTSNKIVILYTYKPSEITSENNGYRGDFFDVYTDGEVVPSNLPIQLKTTGYGYDIPSFGVTFGRQDNALFKSFKLSMENPVATEQSIKALSTLASKAGASRAKIQYYGQDIYQVYSGYSYFCEFDMMGDVQIMPLMYFQLLNIPLFRGAYMVIEVSHTMKQGDMTTHVKGMRLSRNALPLTKAWFTPELEVKFDSNGKLVNGPELIDKFVSDESNDIWRTRMYAANVIDGIEDYTFEQIMQITAQDQKYVNRFAWLTGGISREYMPAPNTTEAEDLFNSYMENYEIVGGLLAKKKVYINKKLEKSFELMSEWLAKNCTEKQGKIIKENIVFGRSSYRYVINGEGNTTLSNHSIGAAIDINPFSNDETFINTYLSQYDNINNDIVRERHKMYAAGYFSSVPGNQYWHTAGRTKDNLLSIDWGSINTEYKTNDADNCNPKCIRNAQHMIVRAFEESGSGFEWNKYGDTMHFSFMGGS